ncbi:MAG: hypothetical protein LBG19_02810 [Prevotellaceae bacterium]|jgi:hypothetical protein|nr:hypothetical protein [Prevotellaceae bacterium]
MNKIIILIVVLLGLPTLAFSQMVGNWAYISPIISCNPIDGATYSPKSGIVRMWVKRELPANEAERKSAIVEEILLRTKYQLEIDGYDRYSYTLSYRVFDIERLMVKTIKIVDYNDNGTVLSDAEISESEAEWSSIVPESNAYWELMAAKAIKYIYHDVFLKINECAKNEEIEYRHIDKDIFMQRMINDEDDIRLTVAAFLRYCYKDTFTLSYDTRTFRVG